MEISACLVECIGQGLPIAGVRSGSECFCFPKVCGCTDYIANFSPWTWTWKYSIYIPVWVLLHHQSTKLHFVLESLRTTEKSQVTVEQGPAKRMIKVKRFCLHWISQKICFLTFFTLRNSDKFILFTPFTSDTAPYTIVFFLQIQYQFSNALLTPFTMR